jgi:hypothetical protein
MSNLQRTSAPSRPPDECDWHRCDLEPGWRIKWYEQYNDLDRDVCPRDYGYFCDDHESAIDVRADRGEIDQPQHVKKI